MYVNSRLIKSELGYNTHFVDILTEGSIAAVTWWARPTLPGALAVRAALHTTKAGVGQAPIWQHTADIRNIGATMGTNQSDPSPLLYFLCIQ